MKGYMTWSQTGSKCVAKEKKGELRTNNKHVILIKKLSNNTSAKTIQNKNIVNEEK